MSFKEKSITKGVLTKFLTICNEFNVNYTRQKDFNKITILGYSAYLIGKILTFTVLTVINKSAIKGQNYF